MWSSASSVRGAAVIVIVPEKSSVINAEPHYFEHTTAAAIYYARFLQDFARNVRTCTSFRVGAQEAPALQGLDGRLRPLMVRVGNGQALP
jgi:hypothetical protein